MEHKRSDDLSSMMSQSTPFPGLLRRLAALVYDAAALFSVLFVASALVVIPAQAAWGIENISDHILYRVYLGLTVLVFFGWFWTHGGQTLGLRAWHMRLARIDGRAITWWDVCKRIGATVLLWLPFHLGALQLGLSPSRAAMVAAIPFGLGLAWILMDRRRLAWHDHLSGTRPVLTR